MQNIVIHTIDLGAKWKLTTSPIPWLSERDGVFGGPRREVARLVLSASHPPRDLHVDMDLNDTESVKIALMNMVRLLEKYEINQ